ncbi:hypothetical protein CCACVL1_27723, partial [Corchorus capsularis]
MASYRNLNVGWVWVPDERKRLGEVLVQVECKDGVSLVSIECQWREWRHGKLPMFTKICVDTMFVGKDPARMHFVEQRVLRHCCLKGK